MMARSFFLLAFHICITWAIQDGMYKSSFPLTLEATKIATCWKDGLSPAYVLGKSLEILLGPAVFAGAFSQRIVSLEESFAEVHLDNTSKILH